ncbi:hypothetical protein MRB53_020001 [Persea americana]|uniref:Uncharacterized protein n=1 Tax=Persea americana TaxID=3435 RepID=A0ACC2KZN6_PERAE|nr:hypothetical protein MRB53_020001 [Persea americana]
MLSPSLFYSSLEVNEKQTSQIDLGFLFSATPFVFSRSLAVVAVLLVNLAHVAILPQLMLCLRQDFNSSLEVTFINAASGVNSGTIFN